MTLTKSLSRCTMLPFCAALLLLAGCPNNEAVSPGKVPPQATAPNVAPPASPNAVPATSTSAKLSPPDTAAALARSQQLIARAEASYQSGVTNYRANRLDAARLDFDTAVDMMLTSGMDLKGDTLLADEFDHLVNAVNSLEMTALKQGNGFSPRLEEAPLDATEDLTFAPNPELTAKLKAELQIKSDLPLVINDEVAGYIGYFANSSSFRAHMVHSLARSGKYKAIIQKALADQGLPQDLFYLAVAESGFQPQALNAKSGAGGMWQFMPTGAYGLARNGYFDERFDPEKSSIAYAKYMKTLYNQFGDWFLAMAAYDWGPGNIQKAVMRTGYADFWELYRRNVMPRETKAYVPQILAAVIMAKNPVKYGLDKVIPEAAVISDTVTTHYAVDLRLVADLTNASLPEIVALNPSLLRMSTPADLAFDLHIPVGTHELYAQRIKSIPEDKRTSWRFHVVHTGESLDVIATNLHARTTDIAENNGLKPGEAVEEGDELVVPMTATVAVRAPQRYTARRGDTLVAVADRFNISVTDLRRWNKLAKNGVRKGQVLNVAEPVHLAPSMRSRRTAMRLGRSTKSRANRGKQSSLGASRSSRAHAASTRGSSKRASSRPSAKSTHPSPRTTSHAVKPQSKRKAAR